MNRLSFIMWGKLRKLWISYRHTVMLLFKFVWQFKYCTEDTMYILYKKGKLNPIAILEVASPLFWYINGLNTHTFSYLHFVTMLQYSEFSTASKILIGGMVTYFQRFWIGSGIFIYCYLWFKCAMYKLFEIVTWNLFRSVKIRKVQRARHY